NDDNIIPHLTHPLIQYNNNKSKEVINTPNALHSLTTLSIYKIGTHLSQENDQQTLAIRSGSIECLGNIQFWGDASDQSELDNANYTGVFVIAISTASGSGEEDDGEIKDGLNYISEFIRCLNKGKQNSFPPQPLLAHRSYEQIEEEGGNEEIDSQLINKAFSGNIKNSANRAKLAVLNYFIEQGNPKPDWYQEDQDEEYQDQEEEQEAEQDNDVSYLNAYLDPFQDVMIDATELIYDLDDYEPLHPLDQYESDEPSDPPDAPDAPESSDIIKKAMKISTNLLLIYVQISLIDFVSIFDLQESDYQLLQITPDLPDILDAIDPPDAPEAPDAVE
ncbi:MAG: hypothetical protein EZS28_027941, partial [Streblomastix strix]